MNYKKIFRIINHSKTDKALRENLNKALRGLLSVDKQYDAVLSFGGE